MYFGGTQKGGVFWRHVFDHLQPDGRHGLKGGLSKDGVESQTRNKPSTEPWEMLTHKRPVKPMKRQRRFLLKEGN